MNREVMEKWVAALRSGNYAQGTGCLRHSLSDGTPAYCVLGVLCQIHADETRSARWGYEYSDGTYAYGRHGLWPSQSDESIHVLPLCVQEWAGLRTASGRLPNWRMLSALNDDGCEFPELASDIEAHWKAL
jgi:hypothetical protein